MKVKKFGLLLLLLALMLATVPFVKAEDYNVGTIRIWPLHNIITSSPATFEINCTAGTTYDPHIFLAMTNSCYIGLTGPVTVDWTGDDAPDLTITDWHQETEHTDSIRVPPGTAEGIGYTVESLMDRLGTREPIWWAFEPFLGEGATLTQTPQTFRITLPSTDPRWMLVYALGKMDQKDELFNNRVPPIYVPTGMYVPPEIFSVPELGTIFLAVASFSALALYVFKCRKFD